MAKRADRGFEKAAADYLFASKDLRAHCEEGVLSYLLDITEMELKSALSSGVDSVEKSSDTRPST